MERVGSKPKLGAEGFVAAVIAAIAIVAVVAASVVCLRQAGGLPLLTEDLTWLQFEAA